MLQETKDQSSRSIIKKHPAIKNYIFLQDNISSVNLLLDAAFKKPLEITSFLIIP